MSSSLLQRRRGHAHQRVIPFAAHVQNRHCVDLLLRETEDLGARLEAQVLAHLPEDAEHAR